MRKLSFFLHLFLKQTEKKTEKKVHGKGRSSAEPCDGGEAGASMALASDASDVKETGLIRNPLKSETDPVL